MLTKWVDGRTGSYNDAVATSCTTAGTALSIDWTFCAVIVVCGDSIKLRWEEE